MIAPAPMRLGPATGVTELPQHKLVCVGLNKTGTTTFGDVCETLGYRRLGWRPQVSAPLTLRWHEGAFEPFRRQLAAHDAFEDVPWCLVYREIAALYPNARFVLTRRRDAATWLDSMRRHLRRTGPWFGTALIYGSYDPVADGRRFMDVYERHNDAVRAFFADRPDRLCEMCFEDGDGWEALCGFLGVAAPRDTPFPHANRDQGAVARA